MRILAEVLKRTRGADPQLRAKVQRNLGVALWLLGQREQDAARLRQAIDACRAALRMPEVAPMLRAEIHDSLGSALSVLGEQQQDPAALGEAIEAHKAALENHTREAAAKEWAAMQNNLGVARRRLGALTRDSSELDAARAAFDLCLTEWTRDRVPFRWAQTQWNLADLALARHGLAPDPALLATAREHALAARGVFEEGSEHQTARCDELLARIDAAEGQT